MHQQLGWAVSEEAEEIDFVPIPDGPMAHRLRWLRRKLRSIAPDAIWVQQEPTDLLLLEVLAVARTLPRTRIVGAVCENIFDGTPQRVRLLGKVLWPRLDAIAAVATPSIEGMRAVGLPNGVAAEPLVAGALSPPDSVLPMPLDLPRDCFVVGFAGRVTREKGWRVIVAAARLLPERFAFAFAGDGPERGALAAALAAPELAGRAGFVGLLEKHDLWRFYAALDALAVPSLTTPSWKEQFGGVLADGMALGVPLIGSTSGSIPEVMGPAGIVVPEGDAQALAKAILRLASDDDLRRGLREAGRVRFEEEYSIDAYAHKLGRLLRLDPSSHG